MLPLRQEQLAGGIAAVQVTQTSALAKPSKLTVATPNGQQNCGGPASLRCESLRSLPSLPRRVRLGVGRDGQWASTVEADGRQVLVVFREQWVVDHRR